jgi:NADPH:quinone reductase-like Zn-dependent oxidoreductase
VTASVSTQEKIDFLTGIPGGATYAVNYKTQDFSDEIGTITNGHGVDVIVDVVGKTHFEKNIASLAVDGRMTILAFLSGKFGCPEYVDLD